MNKLLTIISYLCLIPIFHSTLIAQNTLQISNGSSFEKQDFYPEFTWKTTPMYYMFGDGKRVLTSSEVEFIAAKSDFICIEKNHAFRELGSAELGAKHEIAAFKKVKPEIKVLYYFNSAYAWPFTSYTKNFNKRNINKHPNLKRFLLTNTETGELEHRDNVFYFDVLNPEFRNWWVKTVAKGVKASNSDGVFIDQMHGFVWLRKDKAREVQKAMGTMITALKNELGPDKIVLGNNADKKAAQYVFPVADAIMFEHYKENSLSKESILENWKNMLRIAEAGKISVFRIGVEVDPFTKNKEIEKDDEMMQLSKERLKFYHACYLIGAQPYSYFQYGWGWKLSTGALIDYPEFQKPLGQPKGPYKRLTTDGWKFTREFEHACVWVDIEKGKAKIRWK